MAALNDELTVGAVPTIMSGLVPKAIRTLRERPIPVWHLRIVPGLSADLYLQVDRANSIDAAIIE